MFLRVKPPLTALAATLQLLCLSNALRLELLLATGLDGSGGLFLVFLVLSLLVTSPNCALISMNFSLMDELFLISVRGAVVGMVAAYNIVQLDSDPAGAFERLGPDACVCKTETKALHNIHYKTSNAQAASLLSYNPRRNPRSVEGRAAMEVSPPVMQSKHL